MTRAQVFVIPNPRERLSGGNIYNQGLTTALRAAGVDVHAVTREEKPPEGRVFVDSLYLEDVPRFTPCHLLAHYLPSLVAGSDALSSVERAALVAAEGFVVPSELMASELRRLAPSPRPIAIVAPGIEVRHSEIARTSRALLVANLVPGKGVLPFLRALAARPLDLAVVGSAELDPEYAAACRAVGSRVAFLGALSHAQTLAEIAASDFLVSASRMESFGLALAEARALGVPIVARAGGNVRAHVDEAAGGRLVHSDDALVDECLRLAIDRAELEERRRAALARRPPPRSWNDAARDFVTAFTDSIP